LSCAGSNKDLSVVISDTFSDYHFAGDTQCFPLYYYEENKQQQGNLFDVANNDKYVRRDAISDFILERAKKQYSKNVTKEDIFYYVYGFLHSANYRETFTADLKKMLPRLPLVEDVRDFWAFSKAGRKLAYIHLNYETNSKNYEIAEGVVDYLQSANNEPEYAMVAEPEARYFTRNDFVTYQVEKMRFPSKTDKSKIIYNNRITIKNIPETAYQYIVNGKSAIEWIMERYQITTHKESGIINNPNDWARENSNPRYIFDLLLNVINLSEQTVGIVEGLPKVKFE
jgi:predicted helicase